jgi:hypothetical protein
MPKELRQVSFRPAEVVDAISAYYRHRQLKLPPGNITKFIVNDTPVTVTLHVVAGGGPEDVREIMVRTEELAAALILQCINNKIPLPADAEKSLRKIGDDGVSLFVVKESRLQLL